MNQRKLIFFTTTDPSRDSSPLMRAYHFAHVAGNAGLDAEVRLAEDAVHAATLSQLSASGIDPNVRSRIKEGIDGPFLVSL